VSLNMSVFFFNEEKSKHYQFGLAQQNGFGLPFLHKETRLVKKPQQSLTPVVPVYVFMSEVGK